MQAWTNALNGGGTNTMAEKTFPVRGNHDFSDLAGWKSYFGPSGKYDFPTIVARIGGSNYSEMAGAERATYSFDYDNSHFVGIDVNGDVDAMASAVYRADGTGWLDKDLAAAEARGLTHAFLYWHGPIWAINGHCCPTAPADLIKVLNKHPIVSATFHGHEHVLGYAHMDAASTYPAITHEFEQFVVGGAGAGLYSCQSGRSDWCNASYGISMVDVNGNSYTVTTYTYNSSSKTVSLYKTQTFSKTGAPPSAPPAAPRNLRLR